MNIGLGLQKAAMKDRTACFIGIGIGKKLLFGARMYLTLRG